MNALARSAGFVLGIFAIFGIALAVGVRVGPVGASAEAATEHSTSGAGHGAGHDSKASTPEVPGGLMVSSGELTLSLTDAVLEAGRGRVVSFVIQGADGPVTSYDVEHEKRLHFIAVRRDFTGYQHVHPELAPDGTWTTALDLTPGQWRVFADFKPAGADDLTLGSDLSVPGQVKVAERPTGARVSTVEGYTVALDGDLVPGEDSRVSLSVAKDGRPVTDLQPYLGAYGHLVALRGGDLAYLHVHPEGAPEDGKTRPGPDVEFVAEVPSSGGYHLYLDFKHDGVVRTAEFALDTAVETGSDDDLHD